MDAAHPAPATAAARSRPVGLVLTATGLASLALMFVLLLETIAVYNDPGHVPNCIAGSVFACGRVIDSWQAAVLGFPNAIVGIVVFTAVAVLGLVLTARAAMPAWPAWTVWVPLTAMLGMSSWMMLQQFFVIGGLCTYCSGAWLLTGPAWWYLTLHLWLRAAPASRAGAAPPGAPRTHDSGCGEQIAHPRTDVSTKRSQTAEVEGFEPPVRVRDARFQGECIRPLCHTSSVRLMRHARARGST